MRAWAHCWSSHCFEIGQERECRGHIRVLQWLGHKVVDSHIKEPVSFFLVLPPHIFRITHCITYLKYDLLIIMDLWYFVLLVNYPTCHFVCIWELVNNSMWIWVVIFRVTWLINCTKNWMSMYIWCYLGSRILSKLNNEVSIWAHYKGQKGKKLIVKPLWKGNDKGNDWDMWV